MRRLRQIITGVVLGICAVSMLPWFGFAWDFLQEFANPLIDGAAGGDEAVFDLELQDDTGLMENLRLLFYPDAATGDGGAIRRLIRIVSVGVLIALMVWAGARFIMSPDQEDELKKAQLNILFLFVGGFIIYASVRILGVALDLGSVSGIWWCDWWWCPDWLLERGENNVMLLVLGVVKALAFFAAIVLISFHGYRMITAFGREEKMKEAQNGVLNVLMALVFIKIIDYLYYIAQLETFTSDAIELIVETSKFLGYVFGAALVLALIYAWFLLITSQGNDERISKAKKIVRGAVIAVVVILLFLLIVYQVFQDILW